MKKVKANFKRPEQFAWYNGQRIYNSSGPFYLKSEDEKLGSWMVEVQEASAPEQPVDAPRKVKKSRDFL